MKVSEALTTRRSVRGFIDKPVERDVIRRVLEFAARAPSGGNLQPWHVALIAGKPLSQLKHAMREVIASGAQEEPEYPVYPEKLPEPYRSRRFAVGEALYGELGIARDDKSGRASWFLRNFQFFDAPLGLFVHTPRFTGPPQWADLGIWLQSVMLMLREEGINSCPQEAWTQWPTTVRRFIPIAEGHILYTGMAIGYADPSEPANRLCSERAPLDETTTFIGF